MNNTLAYIVEEFGVDLSARCPIEIPNFGRNQLAELFCKLGFKAGAEIGVKRGEFSEVLCKANPLAAIYGVDPYREYEAYRVIRQENQDSYYAIAKARLAPYDFTFMGMTSTAAASMLPPNSLDFVFIDGAHDLQNVVNDICEWTRIVKPGGVISGHDYVARSHGRDGGPNTSHHVIQAVDAYTSAFKINPWFLAGRKKGLPGEVRDKERSWMWVKE